MSKNHVTCLVILVGFLLSGALMVGGGLYYLKKFGTARGEVVDAATGAPVEGAVVELYATFPSTSGRGGDMPLILDTETESDGTFRLRQTVGGSYRLTVRHPDFATYKREAVVLDASSHTDLGRIELLDRPPEPPEEPGVSMPPMAEPDLRPGGGQSSTSPGGPADDGGD